MPIIFNLRNQTYTLWYFFCDEVTVMNDSNKIVGVNMMCVLHFPKYDTYTPLRDVFRDSPNDGFLLNILLIKKVGKHFWSDLVSSELCSIVQKVLSFGMAWCAPRSMHIHRDRAMWRQLFSAPVSVPQVRQEAALYRPFIAVHTPIHATTQTVMMITNYLQT